MTRFAPNVREDCLWKLLDAGTADEEAQRDAALWLEILHREHAQSLDDGDTYIDDNGTVWSRPTAWAYYASCRALHAQRDETRRLQKIIDTFASSLAAMMPPPLMIVESDGVTIRRA